MCMNIGQMSFCHLQNLVRNHPKWLDEISDQKTKMYFCCWLLLSKLCLSDCVNVILTTVNTELSLRQNCGWICWMFSWKSTIVINYINACGVSQRYVNVSVFPRMNYACGEVRKGRKKWWWQCWHSENVNELSRIVAAQQKKNNIVFWINRYC